jgi:hypothetical protein
MRQLVTARGRHIQRRVISLYKKERTTRALKQRSHFTAAVGFTPSEALPPHQKAKIRVSVPARNPFEVVEMHTNAIDVRACISNHSDTSDATSPCETMVKERSLVGRKRINAIAGVCIFKKVVCLLHERLLSDNTPAETPQAKMYQAAK